MSYYSIPSITYDNNFVKIEFSKLIIFKFSQRNVEIIMVGADTAYQEGYLLYHFQPRPVSLFLLQ